MSMTKSQSGHLGGIKGALHMKQKRSDNVHRYNTNPTLCQHCSQPLPYDKRIRKFCNHSCAASHINASRQIKHNPLWHRKKTPCTHCGTLHTKRKFCSAICQKEYTLSLFRQGKLTARKSISNILKNIHGKKCSRCKTSSWLGHNLSLELEHVDGDASNNNPTNLCLLCPNCHSLTLTWKGRNRGNGRKSRGLSLS